MVVLHPSCAGYIKFLCVLFLIKKTKKQTNYDSEPLYSVPISRIAMINFRLLLQGCEVMKLEKGQKYCAENKTPVEKVSMLISGK